MTYDPAAMAFAFVYYSFQKTVSSHKYVLISFRFEQSTTCLLKQAPYCYLRDFHTLPGQCPSRCDRSNCAFQDVATRQAIQQR